MEPHLPDIDVDIDTAPDTDLELDAAIDAELSARVREKRLKLPPFPSAALRLAQLVGQDASNAELARVIAGDQALTADVLRVANAAAYGTIPVKDLHQAIGRIGTQRLARVCLGTGLGRTATVPGALAGPRRRAWQEGLIGALICEELAVHRGGAAADGYLAGLLHDFGKVVVLACGEEVALDELKTLKDDEDGVFDEAAWLRAADRHHAGLGFLLADLWGLPEPLPDLILRHHGDDPAPLFAVVRIADAVTELLTTKPTIETADIEAIAGVHDRAEANRIVRALQKLPSLLSALSGDGAVPPTTDPARPMPSNAVPCAWPVRVITRALPDVRAVAVAPDKVIFQSAQPMAARWVAQAELHTEGGPFLMWFNVGHCGRPADRPGVYQVEAMPFALSGDDRARWGHIVAGAGRGVPGQVRA